MDEKAKGKPSEFSKRLIWTIIGGLTPIVIIMGFTYGLAGLEALSSFIAMKLGLPVESVCWTVLFFLGGSFVAYFGTLEED